MNGSPAMALSRTRSSGSSQRGQEHVERGDRAEVGQDAERGPPTRAGRASRAAASASRSVSRLPSDWMAAMAAYDDPRVGVREQREQRPHDRGDADARQRLARGRAHVRIGVGQALRDLARAASPA